MFYNPREKSLELQTLEELHVRMDLSMSDKQHLLNLQKGFEGEVLFDRHLEKMEGNSLILRDLLLKINGRTIQIDTLPILYNTIHLFEVKNFEGNYLYDDGKMFKFPKHEIINPLNQLERIETHFRQLLKNLGFHFEVKASVVFVNPTFTLYQAPLTHPLFIQLRFNPLCSN
ncbi:nuclease-related domain-containing protein [Bacillus niameyensis]|uniref:nuclease-related domain-containing protein n=1 Tax=Bacillus niameyensis TaxID=1522308 RepID=UPI000785BEDF|nr:nuclease-related domain-containing protein [Bacillus niameyensis]